MKQKLYLAWMIPVLAALACLSGGNSPSAGESGSGGAPVAPGASAIGQIGLVNEDVEHNHTPITASEPFYNQDSVGLLNGGEGRLDFAGGLSLSLFNDTLVGDIQSEAASGSSLLARLRLEFGGFTGSLTSSGKSVGFETPNGAKITIYGTDFFLVYNPGSRTTTVGNFQGSIEVRAEDGPVQPVPEGTHRSVLPSGEITIEQPLTFSRQEFEERSRQSGSPVVALQELTISIIEPVPVPVKDVMPPVLELLAIDPPSIVYGGECPGTVGETRLTMHIFDDSPIANALAEWELNGVVEARPMDRIDDQTFTVLIGPVKDYGVLNVTVRAEDAFGNLGQSQPIQVKVERCIG